jgi:hypothetical protein
MDIYKLIYTINIRMLSKVTIEHASNNKFLVHAVYDDVNYLVKYRNTLLKSNNIDGLIHDTNWKVLRIDDNEFDMIPVSCKMWSNICYASCNEYILSIDTILIMMNHINGELVLSSSMGFDPDACNKIIYNLIHNKTIIQVWLGGGIHPKTDDIAQLFRQNKTLTSLNSAHCIGVWDLKSHDNMLSIMSKSQLHITNGELNFEIFKWRLDTVKDVIKNMLNNDILINDDQKHCIQKILQYHVDPYTQNILERQIQKIQSVYCDRLRALL